MAFNIGFFVGVLLSAALVTWVVADCQSRGVCVVTYEVNEKGVLHFTPTHDPVE
jgi:D-serine dehydratase